MAIEKFIIGKVDEHAHAGLHSTRMRLDSAMASLKSYREQRTQAHIQGHSIDAIPQDEEIVLFFRAKKTMRDCE